MTKRELASGYFKQGYNCAQSVVLAFKDGLNLDDRTLLAVASSFGGGMGRLREVCGAVSGAFIVLGLKYGYVSADDYDGKKRLYGYVQEVGNRFKALNGTYVCRELIGLPAGADKPAPERRTDEYYKKRPCAELVGDAAEILERFVKEVEGCE